MKNGKIDSIYDFTDKGIREVEAWLEPWFRNRKGLVRPDPPIRTCGQVLPAGNFPVSADTWMICLGGWILRVDRSTPIGTVISADYYHLPPFTEMSGSLWVMQGLSAADRLQDEPWQRAPFGGDYSGLMYMDPAFDPISFSASPFVVGAVGLSVGTNVTGGTIDWTDPVTDTEDGNVETTNGHYGFLFHDFGAGVTSPNQQFTAATGGGTKGSFGGNYNLNRVAGETVSIAASPMATDSIGAFNPTEPVLSFTTTELLSPGDTLLLVVAGERSSDIYNFMPQGGGWPNIHVNWGQDLYAVPSSFP